MIDRLIKESNANLMLLGDEISTIFINGEDIENTIAEINNSIYTYDIYLDDLEIYSNIKSLEDEPFYIKICLKILSGLDNQEYAIDYIYSIQKEDTIIQESILENIPEELELTIQLLYQRLVENHQSFMLTEDYTNGNFNNLLVNYTNNACYIINEINSEIEDDIANVYEVEDVKYSLNKPWTSVAISSLYSKFYKPVYDENMNELKIIYNANILKDKFGIYINSSVSDYLKSDQNYKNKEREIFEMIQVELENLNQLQNILKNYD